jgi:exonuclease SbcD
MKIAQFSDLHYCEDYLDEVDRCFTYAVDQAIERKCQAAVISGDLFDRRVEVHQPAVSALLSRVRELACCMPVLILQGTFSHDTPGSLDIFKTVGGTHPVYVADRIVQVLLTEVSTIGAYAWVKSPGYAFSTPIINQDEYTYLALFSCLPPVNKGFIAVSVGSDEVDAAAGEHVYNLMKGWSVTNAKANESGIHTIVVSHGTVNGCITEHGVPMHGNDHEFTTGSLFASKAKSIMLGHIHQHQVYERMDPINSQAIAYPGSIGRLHFGETTEKGFLIWDSNNDGPPEFIETPAKRLIQIEFDGPPDMEVIERMSAESHGADVRIRWTVDEEHRGRVDKKAIEAFLKSAGTVKLEGRIKPIQRQRAAGISQAASIQDKLGNWCAVNNEPDEPLYERLRTLQTIDPEVIAGWIMKNEPGEDESK